MTRPNYGGRTVPFSMRNLRIEHRDRLRLLAAKLDLPMELVVNMALSVGLKALERKVEQNGTTRTVVRAAGAVAHG